MTKLFKCGARVRLASFHGTLCSSEAVEPDEDFWKLIGREGEIFSEQLKVHSAFPDRGERALVKFDRDVAELGLVSHNEIANSLWVFTSDLELI